MFRFVSPSKGFRISILSDAQKYIDAECAVSPALARLWGSLFARMKMTALKEGTEIQPDIWSYVAEGSVKLGIPTLQVIFTHDLHTLYIKHAMVWQPGDEDGDDDSD